MYLILFRINSVLFIFFPETFCYFLASSAVYVFKDETFRILFASFLPAAHTFPSPRRLDPFLSSNFPVTAFNLFLLWYICMFCSCIFCVGLKEDQEPELGNRRKLEISKNFRPSALWHCMICFKFSLALSYLVSGHPEKYVLWKIGKDRVY